MGRPKSKGAYVPLAAQYFMDDAILEAGPEAELLFVRILSFLASVPSDGYVTDRQVRTIVGQGLRNVSRRLDSLLAAGLLDAQSGGYSARSWQKWNRSTEEVGRLRARDRERKAQKSAEVDSNSARNPAGFQTDSELQSSTEQCSTEQGTPNGVLSSEVAVATIRPEIEELLDLLDSEIVRNGGKARRRTQKNRDAIRLMLDKDGHTVDQIARAIRWCQADEFWRSNILSASKLREKYDQLRLAAQRDRSRQSNPQSKAARNAAEYRRVFGGDQGSIPALDPGIGP